MKAQANENAGIYPIQAYKTKGLAPFETVTVFPPIKKKKKNAINIQNNNAKNHKKKEKL